MTSFVSITLVCIAFYLYYKYDTTNNEKEFEQKRYESEKRQMETKSRQEKRELEKQIAKIERESYNEKRKMEIQRLLEKSKIIIDKILEYEKNKSGDYMVMDFYRKESNMSKIIITMNTNMIQPFTYIQKNLKKKIIFILQFG